MTEGERISQVTVVLYECLLLCLERQLFPKYVNLVADFEESLL